MALPPRIPRCIAFHFELLKVLIVAINGGASKAA